MNGVIGLARLLSVTSPTGVNLSPFLNLYPVLDNSKFLTENKFEPVPEGIPDGPTSTLIKAPIPVSGPVPNPILETPSIAMSS